MSERDFRLYLVDILDSGSAVLAFVKDLALVWKNWAET